MINWCADCGEPFETDATWKTLCKKCWLKQNHPESYKNKYELLEIECERCGEVFVDEGWKTMCFRCWTEDMKEQKIEDLEEREQFK